MAKPTKEQIAWFQEWWHEIMGKSIDADLALSWFEKFADVTKEEARKTLELLKTPEVRAFFTSL
jgi:Zn-finger domain-containing protein